MKIKELLKINLDEEINTVVDLDSTPDDTQIKEGLDNFVLTQSLGKHLDEFLEEYNGGTMQSGVWLSGFYGSGKSYFAQIIGLLLQNRDILGTAMRDRFDVKLAGLPNEGLLRNEIGSLSRLNNHVVSFDASKHNNANGLPYMIFSSFLRSLGMTDTWHGLVEYDILIEGQRQRFLETVQQVAGKPWSEIIKSNAEMVKWFKQVLIAMGYTQEQYDELRYMANTTRNEYDAARLKQDLQRYLDLNPDTRIVFFIDEVSEAVTQKKIKLDDLEGVAEALASLGRKVWTIAIAQQRLDDVMKAENVTATSLTKVRDRFRTKIAIEADEVDTIIRHRLLDKTPESRAVLRDYFAENNGIIADVTNIGVPSLKKTDNVDTYIAYYPFYMHQFKLLQYFLFGSSELTQTRVGNRGMIISAFDVLKKEVKNEVADHYHVNATQLCNNADDNVPESLANRYRQAEDALRDQSFHYVTGKKLLQTIHFLTKSEVTHTTAEHIAKSYVNRPENYHEILHEVKKALDILQRVQIVIKANEQYRITNEAEQRILDDMRRFDVQSWEMVQDVNNVLKKRDIIKWASAISVGGTNVRYKVATTDGEVYANTDENYLSVIFSDLLSSRGSDDAEFVDSIRQETADTKGRLTIIPTIKYRSEIRELATELRRLKYISDKTNLTDEEKRIVKSLCSERDHKETRFQELIEKSFLQGVAIYCFNKYILTDNTAKSIIAEMQLKMFENIFTKRLSSELSDSLAPSVFTKQPGQLANYFGTAPDFKFFDTSGTFIGTTLSVVTEILSVASTFISGKDLESKLAGPPTGYSLGIIMTTMAALFRGDKVIVKFNGEEYTSFRQHDATEAFKNSRNFSKASFKAVSQSLSYKQRQEIVEVLKDECDFARNAKVDYKLTYQLNDFDLVGALRDLSLRMIRLINDRIEFDDDYRRMFPMSIAARTVFQQYQSKVTEGNFMHTAQTFLVDANTDEYIKAVERVVKDIKFIDEKMSEIRRMVNYIEEVEDQFQKATGSTQPIKAIIDHFRQRYENDIVLHYADLKNDTQKIRDIYIEAFKKAADKAKASYVQLLSKAEEFKGKLSEYPREWNSRLWGKVEHTIARIRPLTDIATTFDTYNVKSNRSRIDLREVVNANDNVPTIMTEIMIWESDIVTTDPTPTPLSPQPGGNGNDPGNGTQPPTPPIPQPKVRNLKSQIPQLTLTVSEYKDWLMQQLLATNSFGPDDKINLNE